MRRRPEPKLQLVPAIDRPARESHGEPRSGERPELDPGEAAPSPDQASQASRASELSSSHTEEWRAVVGIDEGIGEFYEVSSLGRIRSLERTVKCGKGTRLLPGAMMRPGTSREYPEIKLRSPGRQKTISVHRLVAMAFLGDRSSEGLEVCHENGNPFDNRVENLRWDTHLANMRDRARHGTVPNGERNGQAKLCAEEVQEIRGAQGTHEAIAERFGICRATVGDIKNGRRWGHLAPVRLDPGEHGDEREPPRSASPGCPAAKQVSLLKLTRTLEDRCLHADGVECHFRKICESIATKRREQ